MANCLVYQQNKVETIKSSSLLQPVSIPSQRWEEVLMDFITDLPKSKGKGVIMVVVDKITKYAHFCALSHPFKASIVATAFMETIKKLHGSPKIIVSGRDPISLEIFGWNYFLVFMLNYLIDHLIILNMMGKMR